MPPETQTPISQLPPPWDRIFSLGTRLFVWGLLFATLYLLRSFFLLIFLTFVFAYIQAHGVDKLAGRIHSRVTRVVLVAGVFLSLLLAVGFFLVPHIAQQAAVVANNYETWIEDADTAIQGLREKEPVVAKLLPANIPPPSEDGRPIEVPPPPDTVTPAPGHGRFSIEPVINDMLGLGDPEEGEATVQKTIGVLQTAGQTLLGIGSAFLLALLFSFLIVLDLPVLERGVRGLGETRIGFIYEEVSENIHDFAVVLGRALEAQLLIAIVNTLLTAIGIWILGLPNIFFLSTLVFFCSFVPVAGVIISSTPIAVVALSSGGLVLALAAIGLIFVIHLIEAYVLNPRIYGHHLRMNPVLVLIILTVGGKLFHVCGLILGIPVMNYVFTHAIRRKDRAAEAPASSSSAA